MEDNVRTIADYLQIVRRRKYLIVITVLVLLVLSLTVVLALPEVYSSKATISIERQHIPNEYVKSTVISFAEVRIRQIERKVMTNEKINKMVFEYGLYMKQRNKMSAAELAGIFKLNTQLNLEKTDVVIQGKRRKAVVAFNVSFSDKDPVVTQKIAHEIANLYLVANIKNRAEIASETTLFLEEEVKKSKLNIQEIEAMIAEFKEQNSGNLPELLPVHVASIYRSETQLQQLDLEERMLNARRVSLKTQLALVNTSAREFETMASLKKKYTLLSNKYISSHPDLKALQRKIDNFEETEPEETHTNSAIFLQLKSEMDLSLMKLESISQQRILLNQHIKQLEIKVSKIHQVERSYLDLVRDLDNFKAEYSVLKSKSLAARVSQTLEEEQKAEKFSLIEPPQVPVKADKPNRFKLLIMGFVFSVGVGFGLGLLIELLDGSIRGYKTLENITGRELLVVIPYIRIQEDFDRSKRNIRNFAIICVFLVIGAFLAIHFLYKPLDVLWFKVLHRIELM